jgi:hypothetical protein
MARKTEFDVLFDRLEKAVDQAQEMQLEHLHFLLSMALMEAKQQLSVVSAPLRLVVSNGSRG